MGPRSSLSVAPTKPSPPTSAPGRKLGPFSSDGGGRPVAGKHDGVVVEGVEEAVLDIVEELVEGCGVAPGGAGTAGEQRVSGEQVVRGGAGSSEREHD